MVVSKENRFTEFGLLSVDDIKAVKNIGFCILTTKNKETEDDILQNIRQFILTEIGINIPDGLKIEKDYLIHIFDNHGYDTEIGLGISVTNEEITKIPEILDKYDTIEYIGFEDQGKIYHRFHMKKSYKNDIYHLVVQLIKGGKVENQLGSITFYINDLQSEVAYLVAKQKGIVKQLRAKAKKEYGDRFND